MNWLRITYYTFLRNIRDWKFLLVLIAAPLIVIVITGTATQSIDQQKLMTKTKIAYYDADGGPIAQQFDRLLQSGETQKAFIVEQVLSLEDGKQAISDGKIEAFIYLPPNFTERLNQGEKTPLQIYGNKNFTPAQLLVQGFADTVNAAAAAFKISPQQNPAQVIAAAGNSAPIPSPAGIKQISMSAQGKVPNGLDTWTYLNMLLMLFYGAMLGSFSVVNGIQKNTQIRFDASPSRKFSNVAGLLLGNWLALFASAVIIILITGLALGSNWQGNMFIILTTFLLFTGLTTALGMILGYLTKKSGLSILFIVCINIFFGNGAVSYANGTGDNFLRWVSMVSPHYYGYTILTDVIFAGPAYRIQSSLIWLTVIALVLSGLTMFLGRRKAL